MSKKDNPKKGKNKNLGKHTSIEYASPDHPIYKQGSRIIMTPGFGSINKKSPKEKDTKRAKRDPKVEKAVSESMKRHPGLTREKALEMLDLMV